MNTLNCPNGYATDEALIFNNPNKCSVQIAVYWGCVGVIFAGRLLYTIFQYRLSRDLQKKRKEITKQPQNIGATTATFSKKQKIPLTKTVVFMITLNMVLMYFLWGFNITSTANGTGAISFWIYFSLCAVEGFSMLRHMVKLGSKIIPIKQFRGEKNNQMLINSMEQIPLFRWAMIIAFLSMLCNFILMVVLPVVFPENTNTWLRMSVAVVPIPMLTLIASFYFQTYRLVTHMSTMMKNVQNLGVSNVEMNRVRRNFILRAHSLGLSLTPAIALYILVAAELLPFSVFFVIAQCLVLNTAELGSSIGLYNKKKKKQTTVLNTSDENTNKDGSGKSSNIVVARVKA